MKSQPEGLNASVALATFHITQENSLTTDPDNPAIQVQVGEIRSRGIELEAAAEARTRLSAVRVAPGRYPPSTAP